MSSFEVPNSVNPCSASKCRISSIDCMRGLMLAMVLADHIDSQHYNNAGIVKWTLMGLGFSDASDVFVFLSGFVFGYAYGKRIKRNGKISSFNHGLVRILQIYVGLITCSFCVGLLQLCMGFVSWNVQCKLLLSSCCLGNQSFNTGILSLYIVLLPWLLLLFLTFSENLQWLVISLSLAVYVFAQIEACHGRHLPAGWLFQPMAWQFLMVVAAFSGRKFGASGRNVCHRSRGLFATSLLILIFGLVVKKLEWFQLDLHTSVFFWNHSLIDKSNLGPLRLLHLFSMVYVTLFLWPPDSAMWSSRILSPMRTCGRHSLTLYCIGVVLTELTSIISHWTGDSTATVWMLVIDALALQCCMAYVLDLGFDRVRASQT